MKNYNEMSIKNIISVLRISIAEDGERLQFFSETKRKADVDAACAAVKARKPEIMAYLREKAEKEAEYQRRVDGITYRFSVLVPVPVSGEQGNAHAG